MNEKEIQKLIELVERSNIGELEVSRWGRKVRISKFPSGVHSVVTPPQALPAQPHPSIHSQVPQTSELAQPEPEKAERIDASEVSTPLVESKSAEIIKIKSPMVGTFYRAPSPDSDSYVETGDIIVPGQVLCIIEAMKLMNEIESEVNGRIVKILVENAKPVEYNQILFQVEKI